MKTLRTLLEKIEWSRRRHRWLSKGDALLLAISGGSDSMAMTALLIKLRRKYSLRLVAAHLDHGLLKNSSRTADRVRSFCREHDIEVFVKRADIRKEAKKHRRSMEDEGRWQRYRFFEQVAAKARCQKILTAHTMDDLAETILMRLLRGSGWKGLAAIPVVRRQGKHWLIRPLLGCRKSQLLALARAMKLPFSDDPSNADTNILRNRVRHELLPYLKKRFNPRVDEALVSLGEFSEELAELMEKPLERAYHRNVIGRTDGCLHFSVVRLKRTPAAIRSELLRRALHELKGDAYGFGHSHLLMLTDLLGTDCPKAQAHLPHGIIAERRSATLVIRRR